jgi:hypothetical protein
MEREVAGETEVIGENMPQFPIAPHKSILS